MPKTLIVGAALVGLVALGRTPEKRPTGPVEPAECMTCHVDVGEHPVLHGPVGANSCDACHRLVSEQNHTYALARQGADLCLFCHDMSFTGLPFVHEPLIAGACTACHDPHGGATDMLLGADSLDELCRRCHEDPTDSRRVVHGPVAAGACTVCHPPHAARYPGLLSAPGADLCLSCHAVLKSQLATLRVVHAPVASDCLACHDAHASNHEMLLDADAPLLCLTCHETIRHTLETAATQHAAVTTERACLNCHEPHASDFPRILQNDMQALCFECHDRPIKLADGTTLANIKQVIESGKSLHGPVAQDNCAACHQIHGGDHFRMLIQEYPAEFYAPFKEESYALCFSCHDRHLVEDAQTTSLTDFRNGDLNLHYLHVNRERKGRTCRACHETHASNSADLIRESVPFGRGGWMLPIRFQKLDNGGSCAPGCHVPYVYNRVAPVRYPPADEPPIWPGAGRADEQRQAAPTTGDIP